MYDTPPCRRATQHCYTRIKREIAAKCLSRRRRTAGRCGPEVVRGRGSKICFELSLRERIWKRIISPPDSTRRAKSSVGIAVIAVRITRRKRGELHKSRRWTPAINTVEKPNSARNPTENQTRGRCTREKRYQTRIVAFLKYPGVRVVLIKIIITLCIKITQYIYYYSYFRQLTISNAIDARARVWEMFDTRRARCFMTYTHVIVV